MSTQNSPRLMSTGVLAGLLVVAPLCGVLESALSPLTSSTTAADLVAIDAHQTRFVVSVLIGLTGTALLLPALVGLAGRTAPSSRWASRVAATCAGAAMLGFAGIRLGQGIELQGLRDGLPVGAVAGLLDHQESNPIGAPMVVVFLAGTVLGMLALAVAVWRAGLPKPAAVLIGAFPLVDMASESLGPAGGTAAHVLLLAGLGWIGLALLRPSYDATELSAPYDETASKNSDSSAQERSRNASSTARWNVG